MPALMLPVLVPARVSEPESRPPPLNAKLLLTVTGALAFSVPPVWVRLLRLSGTFAVTLLLPLPPIARLPLTGIVVPALRLKVPKSMPSVAPAMLKAPVSVPPNTRLKVLPGGTFTLPELLNSPMRVLLVALASVSVPGLLMVSDPPRLRIGVGSVPLRVSVPALVMVLVPMVPTEPAPLIVSAPLFCSARLSENMPALTLPVLVFARVSAPETQPPPLNAKLLLTVTGALAFSVPPEMFKSPTDIAELIVAVLPMILTARFGTLIVPPLASSVTIPSATAPVPVEVVSGLKVMFSLPTVEVMLALTLMLRNAFSVNAASPPAVLLMGSATVMSPGSVLAPAAAVEMATLVPALSAVWMVPVVMIDPSFVLLKFGLPVTLVSLPAACIVMSLGSSSH